jgi:hypothetical protein
MSFDEVANIWTTRVPSESRPGKNHTVLVKATCTCESFEHRGSCRHVKRAYGAVEKSFDALRPRPEGICSNCGKDIVDCDYSCYYEDKQVPPDQSGRL